jgi:hypothetical protein
MRSLGEQHSGVAEINAELFKFATGYPGRASMGLDPPLPDVTPDNLRIVPHEESKFLGGQNGWESRCHARSIANRRVSK